MNKDGVHNLALYFELCSLYIRFLVAIEVTAEIEVPSTK